jgi:hypothetical protein
MARGGEAVRELLDGDRGRVQPVGQVGAEQDGAHGEVAGGHRLRGDDRVGHEAVGLAAPDLARPAEAADHLVGDERDAVALQDRLRSVWK